jgi:hypothetical protein
VKFIKLKKLYLHINRGHDIEVMTCDCRRVKRYPDLYIFILVFQYIFLYVKANSDVQDLNNQTYDRETS